MIWGRVSLDSVFFSGLYQLMLEAVAGAALPDLSSRQGPRRSTVSDRGLGRSLPGRMLGRPGCSLPMPDGKDRSGPGRAAARISGLGAEASGGSFGSPGESEAQQRVKDWG